MATYQYAERPTADVVPIAGLLTGWADSGHGSLAQRLAHALRQAITAGLIVDGTRLPPERSLAVALSVSRSTVTAALDDLRSAGLIVSRQGSGNTVHATPNGPPIGTRIADHFVAIEGGIDLAAGNPPDASHLPAISVDVADLVASGGGHGLQPLGLPALRAAIAARHTADGPITDVDQIHVTSGAHQATALVVGALARRGDPVAVEDPSYPGIFDIIDAIGARAVPLSCDDAGVLPEALDRCLRRDRPAVVYLQSGAHNPTGRVPAVGRRRALAEVLDRHGATAIEDCALADLAFEGRIRPELADLCRRATIVTTASFSKVAWGGLRIGWLRAPAPLVERTMHLRLANDLGSSVPAQLLALRLLPDLDNLAARRRAVLAETVSQAAARLRSDLPDWHFTLPRGGSVLWIELPLPDSGPFVQLVRRHGVRVAPGSMARVDRVADPHVRMCVDRPWNMVDEGIRRLSVAWREYTGAAEPVLG